MKPTQKIATGILAAGTAVMALSTQAAIQYDQNVTPDIIFGAGNANGHFATDQENGVELGLRAKVRYQETYNSNGAGTYTFQAGTAWNFEWSINSDYSGTAGHDLDYYTYALRIDTDPTAGTSFTTFDPIHAVNPDNSMVLWDHGIGNNSTANGAGDNDVATRTASDYATLIAQNNVAQNSWRQIWFGIDANTPGTYTFQLEAFSPTGAPAALTEMTVNVLPVPEPATYVAGMLLLLPFGFSAVRRLRRTPIA